MSGVLKRRGLLAGAAALVAGGVAKLAGPGRVEAAHVAPEDVLHADVVNTTAGVTSIYKTFGGLATLSVVNDSDGTSSALFNFSADAIQALTNTREADAAGVRGVASATSGKTYGVMGLALSSTTNASGVQGLATQGATNGVWGENTSPAGAATGVYGLASATSGGTVGVWGRSVSGTDGATGTRGETTATSGATTGVLGRVNSPAGIAVRGIGGSGIGVFGGSGANIGVYADSASNSAVFATSPARGVWGRTTTGIGVFGQATNVGGFGVYGAALTAANTWAGYFEGNVWVSGRLFQGGASGPATSTAQAADGTTRALYSQDSTEPLVEDVGEGTLVGGKAAVKLDQEFAAVADEGAYHVFLTPRGDSKGLYVASQTPTGFEIREQQAGTASLTFSYRVVAKRRGAGGKRLEKLERPKGLDAKDLEPPKLPEAPPVPERPTEPRPEPPRPGRQEAR